MISFRPLIPKLAIWAIVLPLVGTNVFLLLQVSKMKKEMSKAWVSGFVTDYKAGRLQKQVEEEKKKLSDLIKWSNQLTVSYNIMVKQHAIMKAIALENFINPKGYESTNPIPMEIKAMGEVACR